MSRSRLLAAAATVALPICAVAAEPGKSEPVQSPPLYAQESAPQSPTTQATQRYAQELVNRTVARHPDLIELDVHAVPPNAAETVIIAAKNTARIGKKSDPDDLDVIKTGTSFVEINRTGDQNVEVHVPLVDVNRTTIGEVEMTFPYPPGSGFDQDGLIAAAERIRDGMARRILDRASLFEPLQFDPKIPIHTYAQFLVDDLLFKHPQVEIIAIHAKPPAGGSDYPIVASNIGRIGKPADAADLEVISTGKPHVAVDAKGARVEAKLPLQDAAGATIGALAVVFPLKLGYDEKALSRQAEMIRDELRARIPSSEQLYEAKSIEPAQAIAVQTAEQINEAELANEQSLPMTKQVASGEALQTAQEGYSEAIKNQAGVAPSSSKGSPSDTISIRGINVNPVSNYRLNGGLAIAGVMTVPTEDKERLETLKGANALMFGIASPAGIINLVTKRATDVDVTSVSASGTSFGQYYGGADIGRRFGEDKQLGMRVNASAIHLENGVRDTGGHGGLASLGVDWKATNRLTLSGDVEYYRRDTILQAVVSELSAVKGIVPVPRVPDPRNLLSGPWATFDGKTTNAQGRADLIIADGWKLIEEGGRSDSGRARFVTRVGKYNPITGAGGTVTTVFSDQNLVNKFLRTELLGQFTTLWFRHDLTMGVSASDRDTFTPQQSSITLPQKQNIFDPIVLAAPVSKTPPAPIPDQSSKDTGLYAYDTVGIGSKAKILLGFRQTQDRQENGVIQTVKKMTVTTLTRNSSKVESPAYGFLYDILPTTTLFASYMKGLEDGAVAPANAVNANQILAPGVSTQKEVGLRDSYFRGLSISASYFDISRVNAVLDSVTNLFSNNGTIDFKGEEAVIAFELNRQWTINAAGQHLETVQISDDPKINGFTPENTPKFIGNVFVTHRSPLLPGLSVTTGASYVTERFVNPQDQGTIPGYVLLSAGAGYVTTIEGYPASLQFNADNLTNRRYWNSAQQGTFGTGMDRSFKLTAKVSF
jgi:TonB-dependent siderophore receptor